MNSSIKTLGVILVGVLIVGVGLYSAGYKIKIQKRGAAQVAQGGTGKGTPGWRKAGQPNMTPGNAQGGSGRNAGGGGGGNAQMAQASPGSGQAGGRNAGGGGGGNAQMAQANAPAPGSGQGGGRNASGGQSRSGGKTVAQPGNQPGFGPTGGILLPIKVGTESIPVLVNGKQAAQFVGKDLTDHVEDTTLATVEGPRKGWGLQKTFGYLKIKDIKGLVVIDAAGKKQEVSAQQLNDSQTIAMFTYDEQGRLMLISGPKVRGVSKGMTSLEQVKQMVDGRKDLLSIKNVVKIEVKS